MQNNNDVGSSLEYEELIFKKFFVGGVPYAARGNF